MSKNRTLSQLIALVMVICMMFTLAPVRASAATATYNQIYWVATADSRITDLDLREQIKLFSQELQAKGVTTSCLPIVFGEEGGAQDNDIILILDSSLGIAEQGYKIDTSDNRVTVSASDADGLFYGCRNVIKQALLGSVANKSSAPAVLERGLSLDNGRKYYSVDVIKQMIRELSWAEMNTLVLHFTEEMGIGIESELYPWLAGRDGELCTQGEVGTVVADKDVLTQAEVRDIIKYAKKYHVEIIPSLDSPGHLNYLVKRFNEHCAEKKEDFSFTFDGKTYTPYSEKDGKDIGNYLHYDGQTLIVQGTNNTAYSRGIDISNEVAVAFTMSLIAEYAKLFREEDCTQFDIGGDELLGWGKSIGSVPKWQQLDHWKAYAQAVTGSSEAVAYDAFLLYMNSLNAMLRDMGYTGVRMWNDDVLRTDAAWNKVVTLDKDIDIWYWTGGSNDVWDYVDAGYKVYNIFSDYNYYAMTSKYYNGESYAKARGNYIYNEWTPYNFGGGENECTTNVKGSAFGIWSDNPTLKTDKEVLSEVLPMLRAHGAKAWDPIANTTKSYEDFTSDWNTLGDCAFALAAAPDVSRLTVAAFVTKNVRSGGTAVMRVIADEGASVTGLKDSDGNEISKFTVVKIDGEAVEDGKQILYIKFTVTGTGTKAYRATVGGNTCSATLSLWKSAQ